MNRWLKITIVGVLLLLALLVNVSESAAEAMAAVTRPFLNGISAVGDGIKHMVDYLPLTEAGRRELEKLRRENANLKLRIERQDVFRSQNEGLRQLLEMDLPPAWNRESTGILARDPLTWERRFRIGKGEDDGVRPGAAVLERQYVVGRVISTAAHSAAVATLADRECRLSVKLERSNVVGILQGQAAERVGGKPVCLITYLPRDAEFFSEDTVVTSGLSGVVPEGLPVGKLMMWDSKTQFDLEAATHARAKFVPFADFDHFRFATVVDRRDLAGSSGNGEDLQ